MDRRTAGDDGFTLLEVLVAFAILAVSLGFMFDAFSNGVRNADAAESRQLATLFANSKLAALGYESPITPGRSSGAFGEAFAWQLDVRSLGETDDDNFTGMIPYKVDLNVSWEERGKTKSLSFETVKLGDRAEAPLR